MAEIIALCAGHILQTLKHSLQAGFVDPVPARLSVDVLNYNFADLQVRHCLVCNSTPERYTWLQMPIFQTMVVLITIYCHVDPYWKRLLGLFEYVTVALRTKIIVVRSIDERAPLAC
ncbi:uncharacterized protein MELLADRAFT_105482 [Melampsora larici-populina 98AG31]|uniref:Uncharacterized protein n=1 Tax=Melampsora larici-populina (strain 98AG31 / pathotype 3-4-7) TaxID=747676 RepID=F4RI99_MELLP|nr:uncharacterized protein MELLADRAFT_105482 [Melampsora larici-populina 98AG31]EGG07972.1 hypothetical protein MELLADRAFT_105482 [Melampsora larici-populina 98AG31]